MHKKLFPGAAKVVAALALIALGSSGAEANAEKIRIAVLKFGTVNWELNVIKHHGLDKAEGFDLDILQFAGKQATAVALQAGNADAMVSDWIWVSRQRNSGRDFTFIPYSRAVGALVVPADSRIKSLSDLKGANLGIAGGPVDKSWLIISAVATKHYGLDLDKTVEKVFGAPPLLAKQIEGGKIDAVINFWHYVARLEAMGMHRLIDIGEALEKLGVSSNVPMLGYVFSGTWAKSNPKTLQAFSRASRKAKEIMRDSDDEWERLRPLTKAKDDATLVALRDGFRAGIPRKWGDGERADASRLFHILAKLGGSKLVGKGTQLAPGTFWPMISY